MGKFFKALILIGALWAVDAIAFGGRYSAAIIDHANYEGQSVQYGIQDWFKRIGI